MNPALQRRLEILCLRTTRGLTSRVRLQFYRLLGLRAGRRNRLEAVRCRRLAQITLGDDNAFTSGCWLWPIDSDTLAASIRVGSHNYFNRNVMLDACGVIEIGDHNMFGPEVYITDSNHGFGGGIDPGTAPMQVGRVRIGNRCWIGAKAVILKDVELGDGCVVAAGAVVTRSFAPGSLIAGVPAKLVRCLTA